jgi:hypothetical protein
MTLSLNPQIWSDLAMARFTLFVLGTLGAFAAWTLINDRVPVTRKTIPAKDAAELLQQAWADHHTRA